MTESDRDKTIEVMADAIEDECQECGAAVDAVIAKRATLRALTALQASGMAVVAGWRDIESAPKDGTEILLFAPPNKWNGSPVPERVTVGHWTQEEECRRQIGDCGGECRCPEYEYDDPSWMSWDGGFLAELPPTHWQPLPAPPSDGKASQPMGSAEAQRAVAHMGSEKEKGDE